MSRLHKARISVREAVSRQYEELDAKREYVTSCVVVSQGLEIALGGGSVSRNGIEWRRIMQDEGVCHRGLFLSRRNDRSVSSGLPRGNMVDGLPRAYTFYSTTAGQIAAKSGPENRGKKFTKSKISQDPFLGFC